MKARHLLTTIGMAALMLSSGAAYAQNKMTIGFSQVGSESGWRAAETKVSKIEAEKRFCVDHRAGQIFATLAGFQDS